MPWRKALNSLHEEKGWDSLSADIQYDFLIQLGSDMNEWDFGRSVPSEKRDYLKKYAFDFLVEYAIRHGYEVDVKGDKVPSNTTAKREQYFKDRLLLAIAQQRFNAYK